MASALDRIRRFLARREHRQATRQLLKQSRYFLNCRTDLLDQKQRDAILKVEAQCRQLLANPDSTAGLVDASTEFQGLVTRLSPKRLNPKITENLEIALVALSIALAFRTYFYQPFKIPTGSMEDTLLGIHVEVLPSNSLMARMKTLKWATWIFDGVYVREVRAQATGVVGEYMGRGAGNRSSDYSFTIGGVVHELPVQAFEHGEVHLAPGQFVRKGDLLWRGTIKAGDHVFVDKIRWNFCPPERGQVVVFKTDGIKSLDQGIHYIKRLVGLPGETLTIRAPDLIIDGVTNGANLRLGHVARHPGYQTRLVGPMQPKPPIDPEINDQGEPVYQVATNGYFCMGDNTSSSLDSRYWGSVPRANMVGPAVVVYWPFSRRWGFIRWPSDAR